MTLRSLPGERPARSDPVVFDVRLPPGAGPGPAVDRPALREAGRVSSPAFRIGVAVPSATWIPGRTRRPVRGVGGAVDRRRQPLPGVLGTRQAADGCPRSAVAPYVASSRLAFAPTLGPTHGFRRNTDVVVPSS